MKNSVIEKLISQNEAVNPTNKDANERIIKALLSKDVRTAKSLLKGLDLRAERHSSRYGSYGDIKITEPNTHKLLMVKPLYYTLNTIDDFNKATILIDDVSLQELEKVRRNASTNRHGPGKAHKKLRNSDIDFLTLLRTPKAEYVPYKGTENPAVTAMKTVLKRSGRDVQDMEARRTVLANEWRTKLISYQDGAVKYTTKLFDSIALNATKKIIYSNRLKELRGLPVQPHEDGEGDDRYYTRLGFLTPINMLNNDAIRFPSLFYKDEGVLRAVLIVDYSEVTDEPYFGTSLIIGDPRGWTQEDKSRDGSLSVTLGFIDLLRTNGDISVETVRAVAKFINDRKKANNAKR